MTGRLLIILVVIAVIGGGLIVAYAAYRRVLRRAKNIERGLKMVPILIYLPTAAQDTNIQGRDVREVVREKISQAQVLYDLIAGTAQQGFKSQFYGQRHLAFEIIAAKGAIYYYAAVPVAMASVIEQAILTAYPGAKVEQATDHNIFNAQSKIDGVAGGELTLKTEAAYPIATFDQLERDPMEALINSLSTLAAAEGVGVQILLRPAWPGWVKKSLELVKKKRHSPTGPSNLAITPMDVAKAALASPTASSAGTNQPGQASPPGGAAPPLPPSNLESSVINSVEEKTKHPAFEVLIRVLASADSHDRAEAILRNVATSFALFDAPGLNGFKLVPARDMEGLVTAFIFRFFPPELNHDILNSAELATIFHLPDAQFTPTAQVNRQQSKQVDGPVNLPASGLLVGYNVFRGQQKEIHLSPEDRRRHTYIVGQTGTGKSTMLENLAVQDMLAGNGLAFIDPHGDTAERLISMVPKQRSEDIIYFNPADTDHPLGLNLFEFQTPEQKDFLIQEAIQMLYKLYDPGHTGIIGPRYEHWFRNAALTLMSDPAGATFIEIPKVFTDSAYLKSKFGHITDPTVVEFWTKEMAQTADFHKSEMLGWFASKFGAFQSNEIMRNIIGQPKSAFNLREIMDGKKILIVNLSKGQIGELNSQLLGMIFVIKFQAAAMSRAQMPEDQRSDYCLYVDEFQNFSTDSFAAILSEARKYRLNLIVANQFIGQLSPQIRDAVFGNVGTIVSYRSGPEDADFLVKQFAPAFDAHDLVNLPNFNAIIRLMVGGLPSAPFSLSALPPLGLANAQLGEAIKKLSAAKFGVSRGQVEATIFSRLRGAPPPPIDQSAATPPPTSQPAPAPLPPPPPAGEPSPAVPSSPATKPAGITSSVPAAGEPGTLSLTDITRNMPNPTVKPAYSPSPPAGDRPAPTPPPTTAPTDKAAETAAKPPLKPANQIHPAKPVSQPPARPSSQGPTDKPKPPAGKEIAKEIHEAGLDKMIKLNPLEGVLNAASTVVAPTSPSGAAVTPSSPAPPAGRPAPSQVVSSSVSGPAPSTASAVAPPVPPPSVAVTVQPAAKPLPSAPPPPPIAKPPQPPPVVKTPPPAPAQPPKPPLAPPPAARPAPLPIKIELPANPPAVKPVADKQPATVVSSGGPAVPQLAPGEIFVDDSGVVHTGE